MCGCGYSCASWIWQPLSKTLSHFALSTAVCTLGKDILQNCPKIEVEAKYAAKLLNDAEYLDQMKHWAERLALLAKFIALHTQFKVLLRCTKVFF